MTRTLADLARGGAGTLGELGLPAGESDRLMALGFIPGARVTLARTAPGGDPMVFRVDGAEVALRRSMARLLSLQPEP
jgi:Fe2+ transport system protein FeoA